MTVEPSTTAEPVLVVLANVPELILAVLVVVASVVVASVTLPDEGMTLVAEAYCVELAVGDAKVLALVPPLQFDWVNV